MLRKADVRLWKHALTMPADATDQTSMHRRFYRLRERGYPDARSVASSRFADPHPYWRFQRGDRRDRSGTATIPGYTILAELGRGGMGVVYKAHEASLNRTVALKVLLSGAHGGATAVARFRTEAEAAAAVQHPNVVQVFAVGQHNGLPFMAQELVPGDLWLTGLAKAYSNRREAARVVEAIARGVEAAHTQSVLHRDLKPANVLFGPLNEPKVADFGLAKIGDTGMTASGAIMGTPAYMSPEQARGDTKAAGPTTDVWALGAILYECLAGHPPFRGRSVPETLRLVCESDPEAAAASSAGPRYHLHEVPGEGSCPALLRRPGPWPTTCALPRWRTCLGPAPRTDDSTGRLGWSSPQARLPCRRRPSSPRLSAWSHCRLNQSHLPVPARNRQETASGPGARPARRVCFYHDSTARTPTASGLGEIRHAPGQRRRTSRWTRMPRTKYLRMRLACDRPK